MPNIEIHGAATPTMTRNGVAARLRYATFAKDIVITVYKNSAADMMTGDYKPYLRIVCTNATEAQRVVDLLKPLEMDMEVMLLHAFIPAK